MANAATAAAIGIKITAINEASKTLSAISKDMAALGKVAAETQGGFPAKAAAAGMRGLTQVGRAFGEVRSGGVAALETMARFVPAIGAIGAVASVAGIAKLAESMVTLAASSSRTGQQLGLTAQQVLTFQNAGKLAGVSGQTVTQTIAGIQDTLADSVYGRNPQAANMFHMLGMDIGNFKNGVVDVTKFMPKLADQFARLYRVNGPHAAEHFLDMAGISRDMTPMLIDGAAGWDKYSAAAAATTMVTADQVAKARALEQAQAALISQFQTMGIELGSALAPALTKVSKEFSAWIAANPDGIDKFFTSVGDGGSTVTRDLEALVKIAGIGSEMWLLKKLFGFGPAALATGMLQAGAAAGAMGAPMLDDYGRVIGDWGGDAGAEAWRRQAAAAVPAGTGGGASWWQRHMPRLLGGGGGGSGNVSSAVPREGRALLDAIAPGESDGSYRDQPSSSGAKGRYQFLDSTWREVSGKTGLSAFTPENQDRNAWFYAQERYKLSTGGDLSADLLSGKFNASGLNKIWTSLPGGPEHNSMTDGFADRLNRDLHDYPARPAIGSGGATAPGATSDAGGGDYGGPLGAALGRLKIDINHNNAPSSAEIVVSGSHPALDVGTPRVQRSMPENGG